MKYKKIPEPILTINTTFIDWVEVNEVSRSYIVQGK
jgi:hypothetical protein